MEALISGRAGVALVMNGGQLTSIHVDEPERTVPCDPADYRYLIGEGRGFVTFEGVTRDEIVHQLNVAREKEDALELVLILQDPELPEDIRRDAASDLEELLRQGEVGAYLEGILYAHPVPESLDFPGAMRYAREAGTPELLTLLELLWTHQTEIREVREAWDAIPRAQFADDYDQWQSILVREGAFRDVARQRASGKKFNDLFIELSQRSAIQALSNRQAVLWSWAGAFLDDTTAHSGKAKLKQTGIVRESNDDD